MANAIVRRSSALAHFRPEQIIDPEGAAADSARAHRGRRGDGRLTFAVDVVLHTTDGRVFERGLDIAPGFPRATT